MYLYRLTFPNGKVYIGVTTNPKKRFSRHYYNARTHRGNSYRLYNAIRKYGWELVNKDILMAGDSTLIFSEEKRFIFWYKSQSKDYGYNLAPGGVTPMLLGMKHRPESILKMKGRPSPAYWKGKTLSSEHKQRLSEARKRRPSPSKGCKWSDESRSKIMKVSDQQAEAIKLDERSQCIIAKEYGISQAQVSRIKGGLRRVKKC